MGLVVPAVLPSSRRELQEKISLFAAFPSVDRIQIDVVDGKFASPASWPYTAPLEFERMVKRLEMLPNFDSIAYEIDLMCTDVDRAIAGWLAIGARRFLIHAESVPNLPKFLAAARVKYAGDLGASDLVSFGLALNIATDLAVIEPCLSSIDYVQFMGIATIGRQGQPFDERVIPKVRVFHSKHPHVPVQVDGGVSLLAARKLIDAGVANVVVGSAILKAPDPSTVVANFEVLRESNGVY